MAVLFGYTARNSNGRFIAGSMQADSPDQVLSHLRSRAMFVTSIECRNSARGAVTAVFTLFPVGASARLAFFRSLVTLMRSGVPLRRALQVTIEQCRDGRLSEALQAIASDIESGTSLSAAMERRPAEFSRIFTAMVRAGEIGGAMDDVLERLATLLERDRSMRKRLSAALAYPFIVSIAAMSLIFFLVATIVPAFASVFAEMHVAIPLSTTIVIAVGNALRSPILMIGLVICACATAAFLRVARANPRLAPALDQTTLALPVIGQIIRKVVTARLTRTLGTLLRSGVDLLDALAASEGVVGNALYAGCLRTLAAELREGHEIAAPLERAKLFDPIVLQLVRVGEETGTLDSMLIRIADYLDVDIETSIAALGSIVEPVLICVLGAVVGTIVASVLIPLYSIIGSIK